MSYLCFAILLIALVDGKLNRGLGSTWNRVYPIGYNGTVGDYVRLLANKTGEFGTENGLDFRPLDYTFSISESLLGLTLKGSVQFNNGVITNSGKIVPSAYAPQSNRSDDLSKAFILFAARLDQLDVTYELKTTLEANNVDGSVEVNMKDVDFFYVMTHTFATNSNTVDVDSLLIEDIKWIITPRTTATYAIETIAKRENGTREWYKESLIAWQKDKLGPMLVQQAQDLAFPISPN